MMKKGILISLLILSLIFSITVFGESSKSSGTNTGITTAPSLKNLIVDKRFADYLKTIKPYLKSLQEKQTGSNTLEKSLTGVLPIQPLDPAPPLTYLQIYAASSTQHPDWEYFADGQTSSVEDHGGVELYIVTVELGYGYNSIAKMNGSSVSYRDYTSLDLDGDGIIDGWMYEWNASGYNSGTFTYQSTSINYPWNTMSDSIYIR